MSIQIEIEERFKLNRRLNNLEAIHLSILKRIIKHWIHISEEERLKRVYRTQE